MLLNFTGMNTLQFLYHIRKNVQPQYYEALSSDAYIINNDTKEIKTAPTECKSCEGRSLSK